MAEEALLESEPSELLSPPMSDTLHLDTYVGDVRIEERDAGLTITLLNGCGVALRELVFEELPPGYGYSFRVENNSCTFAYCVRT